MFNRTHLAILLCVALFSEAALAQATRAAISGEVHDTTGGVLPGCTVIVTNLDTGIARSVLTNDLGRYHASNLPLGNYQVEAELPGFQTAVRTGIKLTVGREAIVDFVLQLGEVTERVTVVGEAPLVETTSSSLGELVDDKKIRDLPLNGRDLAQLALLQGNVAQYRHSGEGRANDGFGIPISISGSRPTHHLFMLDGTDINDAINKTPGGASGAMTGVETVQEFKVLTNTFSAEYGRGASGAVFNIATKSGTNQTSGSLFHFHRNDNLDARNFFDRDPSRPNVRSNPPEFKRNQFGFTLGGPLKRNKTFYFGSYEGMRERLGITRTAGVPSINAREGLLEDPATGRLIRHDVHPLAKSIMALYPLPNGLDLGRGVADYIVTLSRPTNEDFTSIRVDHVLSASHSAYTRYTFKDSERTQPKNFPNQTELALKARSHYVTIEETASLSPTLLNQFRFGFSRSINAEEPDELFIPELTWVPGNVAGRFDVRGAWDSSNGGRVGMVNEGDLFVRNDFLWTDDLSTTAGAHTIKTGASVKRSQYNSDQTHHHAGNYSFRSVTDFYQLRPNTFQALSPEANTVRGYRQTLVGFYFQDDYKPRANLTLNLGVRYEFTTTPYEVQGKLATLRTLADTEMAVGLMFDNPTYKEVAPRVGVAWDPFSDGKTAVRAGFGVFFEPKLYYNYSGVIARNPPHFRSPRIRNPRNFPNDFALILTGAAQDRPRAWEIDPRSTYAMQWNLNLQRQVGQATMLSAGYAASRGIHLLVGGDANTAVPEILPDGRKFFAAGLRPRNPAWERIQYIAWEGSSNYHSFLLSVNRRFAQGLQFQGAYTFSKATDTGSDTGRETMDPYDRRQQKGLADHHISNNFTFNMTYDLPFLTKAAGLASRLFGGWQVNTIIGLASGNPFTALVESGLDRDRDRSLDNPTRPDPAPGFTGNPILGEPNLYFDPRAFVLPDPGFYGTLGRNTLTGPGYAVVDLSLVKNIHVAEGKNLQFKAEFFNAFNRANFAQPDSLVFATAAGPRAAAGRITETVTSARQIQFGLKFIF